MKDMLFSGLLSDSSLSEKWRNPPDFSSVTRASVCQQMQSECFIPNYLSTSVDLSILWYTDNSLYFITVNENATYSFVTQGLGVEV